MRRRPLMCARHSTAHHARVTCCLGWLECIAHATVCVWFGCVLLWGIGVTAAILIPVYGRAVVSGHYVALNFLHFVLSHVCVCDCECVNVCVCSESSASRLCGW